jgi:alanine-synthesizing transaminase
MFSSRLRWNLTPNPLARLIAEKRSSGERILDLTESNPTHAGFEYPAHEILASLSSPESLHYDPNPAGMLRARESVASYYKGGATGRETNATRANTGRETCSTSILLTASTSEAYGFLFKLLADPGDEVLVPRPSYPLFEFLAELESVRVVPYPLVYDHGWAFDFEALERAIGPRTRAIVIVNPNNPTGSFLKRDELRQLANYKLPIISDEVFTDFGFAPDPQRVSTLAEQSDILAFSLSGLSKIAGLPQMKLGWIVASGPAAERAEAYSRLELIADTYLSVGTPVQCAAAALIESCGPIQNQIRQRTAANLAVLRERTRSTAFGLLDVEGGWYATLRAPRIRSEEEWALELLRRENVLVQPGFFYDFDSEAFLVLSLLTPEPIFSEGSSRLLALD